MLLTNITNGPYSPCGLDGEAHAPPDLTEAGGVFHVG
jgi:hypothetical protein